MLKSLPNTRETYVSDALGIELVVYHASYGKDAELDDVIAGIARPVGITATEDGRHADRTAWHEGPSLPEDWVAYEAIDGARGMHGYVHRESRRLLQVG